VTGRRAGAILAVVGLGLLGLALIGQPLGHDEAVYALGGKLVLGGDASPFPLHRPIAMALVAAPAAWAGADLAFRLSAIFWTGAFLTAAWALARRAYGSAIAAWAVVVIATSYAVVRRGTELLPDAPAGACVLGFATILIAGLRDGAAEPRARARLVWAGPLALAAFYLRYGSLGTLGAIALAAAIVWRAQLRACARPLALGALLAGLGLIPHAWQSAAATGDPLGMLRLASQLAGRAYTGEGLVFYATAWWAWLGPAAAIAVAAGAVAAIRRRDEVSAMFGLAAAIAIVLLGLDAHGEARFVLVPEVLLVSAGCAALAARAAAGRWRGARIGQAGVALSFAIALAVSAFTIARARDTFATAVDAGAAIAREVGGQPCRVWCGQWSQLEWYSGCRADTVPPVIGPAQARGLAFLVWFERGRREDPAVLAAVRAGANGVRATLVAGLYGEGLWGSAEVYRLTAP
jgi:hypothetical protein